jgi:pyrroline-5-carboxylate reductase
MTRLIHPTGWHNFDVGWIKQILICGSTITKVTEIAMSLKIGFIGAGNMTSNIISGLIAAGYDPENVYASNPHIEKLQQLQQQYKIQINTGNRVVAAQADVIVLAVKPKFIASVLAELKDIIVERQPLIISVAAMISLAQLQQQLDAQVAIIRCMPNTPAAVRCGASALVAGSKVTAAQKQIAEKIFQSVGMTVWLEEEAQLAAVTALSGCGPAYFFLFMEYLEKSAEKLGLPKTLAHQLTLQTALGAARLALEKPIDLVTLREHVTSKGGATEQAIAVFQQAKLEDIFLAAMRAAQTHAVGK